MTDEFKIITMDNDLKLQDIMAVRMTRPDQYITIMCPYKMRHIVKELIVGAELRSRDIPQIGGMTANELVERGANINFTYKVDNKTGIGLENGTVVSMCFDPNNLRGRNINLLVNYKISAKMTDEVIRNYLPIIAASKKSRIINFP